MFFFLAHYGRSVSLLRLFDSVLLNLSFLFSFFLKILTLCVFGDVDVTCNPAVRRRSQTCSCVGMQRQTQYRILVKTALLDLGLLYKIMYFIFFSTKTVARHFLNANRQHKGSLMLRISRGTKQKQENQMCFSMMKLFEEEMFANNCAAFFTLIL